MMIQTSLNNLYLLEGTLEGHRGAIVCLSATEDGSILASGGDRQDHLECFSWLKVHRY